MKHISEYDKYLSLIKEGLIRTHNIEKYRSTLEIQLDSIGVIYELNIINKFVYEIKILNTYFLENDGLLCFLDINKNLLGYYPSYIWCENDFGVNSFKYDSKYLDSKYKTIKIRFEAKYEDGLYTNNLDVPEYCYHLSPSSNNYKILKDGMYPKSYSRSTSHPDRIYLFYDKNKYDSLLNLLKMNDKKNGLNRNYNLYKIKLSNDIIIHSDPNYSDGFFIYDSISPKNIELILSDL